MSARREDAAGEREKRELLCEVCNREYRVWFAPNPLWNAVVRRDEADEWNFLCPTCFTSIAAERGVEGTAFEVRLEQHDHLDIDERNAGAIGMAQQLLCDDGSGVMGPGPCANAQAEWRRMKSALSTAEREREELQRDKERLDWLSDPAKGNVTIGLNAPPFIPECSLYLLGTYSSDPGEPFDAGSLREAIDRARGPSGGEEGRHVCGVRGFDGMQGDTCPACAAARARTP